MIRLRHSSDRALKGLSSFIMTVGKKTKLKEGTIEITITPAYPKTTAEAK